MKLLLKICFLLFLCSCLKYREYKMMPIPNEVNPLYLRDSLRYLNLAVQSENVIQNSLNDGRVEHKLLTFKSENIRVLMIFDTITNTQIINIVPLSNADDLHFASRKMMKKIDLFTFQVNGHYLKKYVAIREDVIKHFRNGVVKINTVGTASAYGTLLAIEASSMQLPVESVIEFAPTRFTTQQTHDSLLNTFAGRLVMIAHENDISHRVKMLTGHATTLNEWFICEKSTQSCNGAIFELRGYSLSNLLQHFLDSPEQHTQVYHDSLLKYSKE